MVRLPGLPRQISILSIVCLALCLSNRGVGAEEPASHPPDRVAVCADGMVNGLITISIASVTAVMAEIAMPPLPFVLATGLGVGCVVRVVGSKLKDYALESWYGRSSGVTSPQRAD